MQLPVTNPGDAHLKTFYVGQMSVGSDPQRFWVSFDTASGQVVFPAAKCRTAACMEHRRYSPHVSTTAVDINADGGPVQDGLRLAGRLAKRDSITIGLSSVDLGEGRVTGDLLREVVCVGAEKGGHRTCAELGVVAATHLPSVPFQMMPHDGTIGLGMSGLSISPSFNFFGRYLGGTQGLPAKFGMFLGAKGGELALGGYNTGRLASPLKWVPVLKPEEGYWQVRILSVRVGNYSLPLCKEEGVCRGIIDSCASRLGVPASAAQGLEAVLGAAGKTDTGCRNPDLHIDLEGATLTLKGEDYASGEACKPQLATLNLPAEFAGAFLLGEPMLQRYYTVFDGEEKRLGFGLASGTEEDVFAEDEGPLTGLEIPAGIEAPEILDTSEPGSTVIFLLQAFAMQVAVVFVLSCSGAYVKSTQLVIARVGNLLARWGLVSQSSGFIVSIPASEVPKGDECVICLGSCEEDCCNSSKGGTGARPRWCRLQCGHHFHEECIFEWLWKVQRCPVCRCHMLDTSTVPWARRDNTVARPILSSEASQ